MKGLDSDELQDYFEMSTVTMECNSDDIWHYNPVMSPARKITGNSCDKLSYIRACISAVRYSDGEEVENMTFATVLATPGEGPGTLLLEMILSSWKEQKWGGGWYP